MAARAGEPHAPRLLLPQAAREFGQRQGRLQTLAAGHPMREYLSFVAALAGAQQQAIKDFPSLDLPDPAQLRANADRCGAPLPAIGWSRAPVWRAGLRRMLERLAPDLRPETRDLVQRLGAESDAFYELQADRLLGGVTLGLDLAAAPLIGAALQVYWVRLVAAAAERFGQSIFDRPAPGSQCPCCGSRPTVSVVRIGGLESGYRYLHCALCSAQWHLVRIMCSHCLGTKGIHYQSLDWIEPAVEAAGQKMPRERAPIAAVRAECCDPCGHYLKILSMEKDPDLDPVADDLASIALDLLVSESGKTSAGINLMLLYGDPGDG
ncbi:MAG TPA: formate dehydrogenase accessory protein FdhE [Burkholderiaceae bacterium]|nr:formate dehydrogenase accessory protein FdhE [Burkholderiaceae bacterium]